jgi:hypothetical protein
LATWKCLFSDYVGLNLAYSEIQALPGSVSGFPSVHISIRSPLCA